MALTAQQIKELDIASQRIAGGGGSQTDIANVNYAKQNYGYAYKPVTQPVSGTQGVQQVQQNPAQQAQTAALTPTQYNQIRTQNNVSPQNFDQYFERRGTDIYAKNQAPVQQTPVQEPVPNVEVPDVIPQQDFERFNNANDLGELKNQVTNAINNYQNQLLQAQQISVPDVNLRQQLIEDTGLAQKQQQLTELNNALRSLEDELAVRFQGRDLSASEFQSELARRAEPLTRQQQMVFEQVSAIQQQINQQVSDQWQQYQAKWQQAQGNAQMAGQYLQVVQSQLDSLFEQQRQGRVDELDLLGVALQLPPGQTFTLSDGTEITGMGSNGNLHFIEEKDANGNLVVVAMNNFGEVVSVNTFDGFSGGYSTEPPDIIIVDGQSTIWNPETGQFEPVNLPVNQSKIDDLKTKLFSIDSILDHKGLNSAVGPVGIARLAIGDAFGNKDAFIGTVSQLVDKDTLDTLVALKEKGGTLGALSDEERIMLKNAASKIGSWEEKNRKGEVVGYDVDEETFKKELETMRDLTLKALKKAGVKGYENLNEYLKYNPEDTEKIKQLKKDRPDLSDDDILDLTFSDDLSRSENYSSVDKIAQAIGQYESGGNYQARGPVVTSGQYKGERALGKYQIMPGNLPSWSMAALGREVSEQEFLNSPKIQDSIAQYKMNEIYKKYGTVEDVASVWFSGQPVARAGNAKDVLGTSVPQYVKNITSIYNRLS